MKLIERKRKKEINDIIFNDTIKRYEIYKSSCDIK